MPNHCENELYITTDTPEELDEILEFIKGEPFEDYDKTMQDRPIDFNKILPYPKEFEEQDKLADAHNKIVDELREWMKHPDAKKGHTEDDWSEWMDASGLEWSDLHMKDGFNAKVKIEGIDEPLSGYDWNCKYRGTKWNAYEIVINNEDELAFSTAWSPPRPVIKELGKKFPKAKFHLKLWEGGNAFKGDFIMDKGENTIDSTVPYIVDEDEPSRGG